MAHGSSRSGPSSGARGRCQPDGQNWSGWFKAKKSQTLDGVGYRCAEPGGETLRCGRSGTGPAETERPLEGASLPFSQYPAWSQLPLLACPTLPMPYCHPESLPCCIFSLCPHGSTLLLKKNIEETLSLSLSSGLSALGTCVRLSEHLAATVVTALLSHKKIYGTFILILGSFGLWP